MIQKKTQNINDIFLTAEWRKLMMVNYVVDPQTLKKYVPGKTELDTWNGQCFISLVAFMFINTKVKGCRIPFHGDFEEVNLRFYVRYKDGHQWKRGVVFIREFVPLPMVTVVANTLYQERYRTIPMKHKWTSDFNRIHVEYKWKRKEWHSVSVECSNQPTPIVPESEMEFITQHFWGYSQKQGYTSEYRVDHEPWHAYEMRENAIHVNYAECYGSEFGFIDALSPHSIYLAEGSPITVFRDRRIG